MPKQLTLSNRQRKRRHDVAPNIYVMSIRLPRREASRLAILAHKQRRPMANLAASWVLERLESVVI